MRTSLARLFFTLSLTQAADSPQVVIDKAIQARGGLEQLAQIKAYQTKVKGHIYVADGQAALPFIATIQSQLPSQYKHVMDYHRNGQPWIQVQIYSGDKASIKVNDDPQDLDKIVEHLQRIRYAERLTTLVILKDKKYQLSSLADSKVDSQDAAGVLVAAPNKTLVKLFFDKSTGLLVKTEHRLKDPRNPDGEEITQETFYSDYRIPDTTAADEQVLKTARIESDGPALLEYFRRGIATPLDLDKVKALIRQLGDDSFEVREKATQALIAIGEPAVPFLQQAAKSTDLEVVRRAERCLQAIVKDPAQHEKETATSIAAARMLARKKPAGAAEALLAYLPRASNPEVEREVGFALRVLAKSNGAPEPALVKALEDKDSRRRLAAAEALGRVLPSPGSRLLLPDVKYPMKGVVLRDGKKFMDWEVLEVIFLNHIDDKEFAIP
jgi:hypothetical protein